MDKRFSPIGHASLMKDSFDLLLLSSAPLLGVIVFLLFALMILRLRARAKASRMLRAEQGHTGLGATTWDAMQDLPTSESEVSTPSSS